MWQQTTNDEDNILKRFFLQYFIVAVDNNN